MPGAPGPSWPGRTRPTTARRSPPRAHAPERISPSPPAWTQPSAPRSPRSTTTRFTPIRYPRAAWDDQLRRWVSDAEVAETQYTAFGSKKKDQQVTARLIVRRVRDLSPRAQAGQGELFPAWRYHAIFTDSPFTMLQAEEQHRDHAVIEQVFADLTSGPLAHAPSGRFAANAAWLTLAAIAHNLTRAAGTLASPRHARARGATIRRDLINVAARIARHGRGHLTLHLPDGWHRQAQWQTLFRAGCGPPQTPAT
jgi:hypothetical protein